MPAATAPYLLKNTEGEALSFLGSLAIVKVSSRESRMQLTIVEFLNPPGFAPPLHVHRQEDEVFYLLSGTAQFRCDASTFDAGPGDLVMLPVGLPHTFVVGDEEPLRCLQITTPGGFENFARTVGTPVEERRLPATAPLDPIALGHAAAQNGIEILGPPPNVTTAP